MPKPSNVAAPATVANAVPRYYDRSFDDRRHDPYQPRGKWPEPTVCSDCAAVFHSGRWQWGDAPEGASETRCPACRRIHERMPAGIVVIEGLFFAEHRQQILDLVRNEAGLEEAEHPQNRLMFVDEAPAQATITCTDIHLPQRIGKALARAYRGKAAITFAEDEYSVRVVWRR
jgi:hypothetical protein